MFDVISFSKSRQITPFLPNAEAFLGADEIQILTQGLASHRRKARPAAPTTAMAFTPLALAAAVTTVVGAEVVVEFLGTPVLVGLPVRVAVVVVPDVVTELLPPAPVEQAAELASTAAKLAQVMRVVLAKWNTKLRLPKKAPMPSTVEANLSR